MRIRFWGVRGSIPVPGETTVKYGGNTPCFDILTSDGQVIIIDAGTGIRLLGQTLLEEYPRRVLAHLFLSHTHWDHIQGLPFFAPLVSRRNQINVYGGKRIGKHLEEILAGQFFEPYLPFAYRSLQASMKVHELDSGETISIGEHATITAATLNHPGGALGFRIEDDGHVLAYCCDTAHDVDHFSTAILALSENADLLIHDAHFANRELSARFADWGHSSWYEAARLARASGAKTLALFHYAPDMTDGDLDSVRDEAQAYFPRTIMAREGMAFSLPFGHGLLS